ncbi:MULTISPECIES: hypothetical protein [unclassified Dietzia]|uniref:hypothetical protein n=1 Tax=unclassified Dietzia TaxID=2617939 RepID=UPI0015F8AEBC|nr:MULTISPECIES: hypothetical protein [unclassified Dietzia]MBB1023327.1 hypothetical protein [Dietzia sp. DQ12-76]MBB1026494.1 hypothetical protein [Dietzia sp. DQ11-38-2]
MTREEAMHRHPAGTALEDARDREAMAVGNSGRMDRLNERHHAFSTGPRARWANAVGPVSIVTVLFALVLWGSVASDFGRWLAWGF